MAPTDPRLDLQAPAVYCLTAKVVARRSWRRANGDAFAAAVATILRLRAQNGESGSRRGRLLGELNRKIREHLEHQTRDNIARAIDWVAANPIDCPEVIELSEKKVARPAGLEPATSWFVARRSIQLS